MVVLPADVQQYWLPLGKRTPHGYYPLHIEPPPVFQQAWDSLRNAICRGACTGSSTRPIHLAHTLTGFQPPTSPTPQIGPLTIASSTVVGSLKTSRCKILDRQSVLSAERPIHWVDGQSFQQVLEAEMRNMVASIATYYRYLTVAKATNLVGDIEALFPSSDRLALLARCEPKIYCADAPWPLKRACRLLAMEIVRARYRNRGQFGGQYGARIREETDALFHSVAMNDEEGSRRVVISWQQDKRTIEKPAARPIEGSSLVFEQSDAKGGQILLRGRDLQSTLHLVDYLLDLSYAPLHGRAPVEVLFTVLKREWEGTRLMNELAKMPDTDVAIHPKRPRNPHVHDEQAWADKVHRMVRPLPKVKVTYLGRYRSSGICFSKTCPCPTASPSTWPSSTFDAIRKRGTVSVWFVSIGPASRKYRWAQQRATQR